MQKKLPKYILRRSFDYHFLFTDYEVNYNDQFNKQIQEFSKKNGGIEIIVEIMNFKQIKEYKKYSIIKISNTDSRSLSVLENIPLIRDQSVSDLLGYYYIFDDTKEWEFYVSIIDETSVFGCNNSCIENFREIFKPYKDFTLNDKIKEIYSCCDIREKRQFFIKELCNNYKL